MDIYVCSVKYAYHFEVRGSPVAVPLKTSMKACRGMKNCPVMRRETLTWPTLSVTL